jgi:uncharacterized membrane protein YphA (DoxX/SURF4 family)
VRDDRVVSPDTRAWIGTLFRLVLAGILFWSGLAKLLESSDGRREAILAYRVFPAAWVDFLGWALPTFEVALGAALLTALLMLGFIVGISSVWIRGYSIDCGCFGGGGDVSEEGKAARYTAELLRDFLFMGLAVWLVAWPWTKFSLDGTPFDPSLYDDISDDDHALEEPTR